MTKVSAFNGGSSFEGKSEWFSAILGRSELLEAKASPFMAVLDGGEVEGEGDEDDMRCCDVCYFALLMVVGEEGG